MTAAVIGLITVTIGAISGLAGWLWPEASIRTRVTVGSSAAVLVVVGFLVATLAPSGGASATRASPSTSASQQPTSPSAQPAIPSPQPTTQPTTASAPAMQNVLAAPVTKTAGILTITVSQVLVDDQSTRITLSLTNHSSAVASLPGPGLEMTPNGGGITQGPDLSKTSWANDVQPGGTVNNVLGFGPLAAGTLNITLSLTGLNHFCDQCPQYVIFDLAVHF
jgi:hypothetical protein